CQAKRRIIVLPRADRVDQLRKIYLRSLSEQVDKRLKNGRPALCISVVPCPQLFLQFKQPRPSISTLKTKVVFVVKERKFHREIFFRYMGVQQLPDLPPRIQLRIQLQQTHDRPITVDSGMPIKTPIKYRT